MTVKLKLNQREKLTNLGFHWWILRSIFLWNKVKANYCSHSSSLQKNLSLIRPVLIRQECRQNLNKLKISFITQTSNYVLSIGIGLFFLFKLFTPKPSIFTKKEHDAILD